MNIEIGQIITGKISGIKQYGMFIEFDNTCGFCYIANASHEFIKDLHDEFEIGQEVTAKIIEITDDNKINVSIKACSNININQSYKKINKKPENPEPFEDMLKGYLKKSEENLQSINGRIRKHRKR